LTHRERRYWTSVMTGAAEVQDRLATFKQAMEQLSAIGNIRVLVTGEMVSTAMAPRAGFEPATIRLTDPSGG
jgi:hypothetical protein